MPALELESFAVRASPVQGKPLFLKEFGQDYITILQDLYFNGHLVRVQDEAHIGTATPQAAQHSRARLDGVCRHVWRRFLCYANRLFGESTDLIGSRRLRQARR